MNRVYKDQSIARALSGAIALEAILDAEWERMAPAWNDATNSYPPCPSCGYEDDTCSAHPVYGWCCYDCRP